jgi:hypothetical protein
MHVFVLLSKQSVGWLFCLLSKINSKEEGGGGEKGTHTQYQQHITILRPGTWKFKIGEK